MFLVVHPIYTSEYHVAQSILNTPKSIAPHSSWHKIQGHLPRDKLMSGHSSDRVPVLHKIRLFIFLLLTAVFGILTDMLANELIPLVSAPIRLSLVATFSLVVFAALVWYSFRENNSTTVDHSGSEMQRELSNRARVCTTRSRRYVPPIRVWDVPLRVRMTVGTENLEVGGETRDERQCVVQPINR